MILYLDTSSLVKLYVDEPGSEDVHALLEPGDTIACAAIGYVELRAALARRRRERRLSAREFGLIKRAFEADWQRLATVSITPALCHEAGDLAERHGLRSNDSIHLAAYAELAREAGIRNVEFSGFDVALNRAAQSLRRTLLRNA